MSNETKANEVTSCGKAGCKNVAFVGTLCTYHFNRAIKVGAK